MGTPCWEIFCTFAWVEERVEVLPLYPSARFHIFLSNGFRLSKKHDRYKISKTDEQTFMRDFPLCPEERKSGEAKGNLIFSKSYYVRVRNVICRIF